MHEAEYQGDCWIYLLKIRLVCQFSKFAEILILVSQYTYNDICLLLDWFDSKVCK